MGSTSMHREPGTSDREFWQGQLASRYRIIECATVGGSFGGTFYAAVETTTGPGAGEVWALVCLTRWVPRDFFNYTYKEMTEQDGPTEASCPARVLDLLTPLPECSHDETWCRLCAAEIVQDEGTWITEYRPGWAPGVAGERCYSGYPVSAAGPDGERPRHEPGGHSLTCGPCNARTWRARCRELADRRARAAKVKPGQLVRFARPIRFTSGAELDTLALVGRDTFENAGSRYRVTGWRTMAWELVTS